jgi:hypothetical protein
MIPIHDLIFFIIAAFILVISPGPNDLSDLQNHNTGKKSRSYITCRCCLWIPVSYCNGLFWADSSILLYHMLMLY